MFELSPVEKFQVSLISPYSYERVKDVIDEACIWQLNKALKGMVKLINKKQNHPGAGLGSKAVSELVIELKEVSNPLERKE